MGCDSPHSNFNNFHWHDGQWYVTSGWDYTYEAPYLHLIEDKIKNHKTRYHIDFNEDTQTWKATPYPEDAKW
jgi:hypothetical protein